MPRLALTGGAYQARSVIASAQRCLNLYNEPLPSQQGEPAQYAHYPTPGLTQLGTMPQGPIRGIRQATNGNIYVVAGSGVYLVDPSAWTGTLLGNITALRPYPVSMQDNGLTMVIVDGTPNGWTVDLSSNAFAQLIDPNGLFAGADRVDFLDTYFLFNKPGTPQFYSSLSLSTSFDSLAQDFANKESFSDLLVTLCVSRREIWLLGEKTTEIWYDVGASSTADFQFQEVPGVFVDHGCAAKYSVAEYDNSLFWLTADRTGTGYVLQGAGYQTKRVSTFAIEHAIATYPRIDDAIGMVYSLAGHTCYVLTFPTADHTWVYDITSGFWHEWCWLDTNGEEHRHRANCMYPINGKIVVGDWENGNLYQLDRNAYTDNGAPIKRQRAFPHTINNAARVFYREFIADLEAGNEGAGESVDISTTFLTTTFTAPDGTLLSGYSDPTDINASWTLVSGSDAAITGDELTGPPGGGTSLYRNGAAPGPDYTVQFRAVPTNYAAVSHASIYVLARSTGAGTGYRAQVAGDLVQYQFTLDVEGGSSTVLAMGTIASGSYLVTLSLRGSLITGTVQRTIDYLFLQPSGAWGATDTPAITLEDSMYTAAGSVFIGGSW